MAVTRLSTGSDATWCRAWICDTTAERTALLATYIHPNGPRRGDMILDNETGQLYIVTNGSGVQQLTGIAVLPIDLANDVTGILPVPNGGTGFASAAQGDVIYGSAVDVFSKLTKDANATRYLSNQGTSNNPSWNQVNLANGVTGTLPDGNLSANVDLLNAAQTISAIKTFTAAFGLLIQRNGPLFEMWDSSQAADARSILTTNGGGAFGGGYYEVAKSNDAHSAIGTLLSIQRSTGNLSSIGTIETVGGSVIFPSTQVPSANPNALDDYEEGTWTPTDTSGAALTFTGPVGTYIKIGKFVYFYMALGYPVTADASIAKITVPFTLGSYPGNMTMMYTTIGSILSGYVREATNYVELYDSATAVGITNAVLSGKTFYANGMFSASA